jgi:hypothetical protein
VFANLERLFHELDLLEGALMFLPLRRDNPVGGIDGALLQAVPDPLIDLTGGKGRTLVFGMPLLTANPSLGLFLLPFPLGLHHVTGWRFGRILRMLPGGGQLG